ncbi:tyrosine-type recombinase/integrase [Sulfurimonas sp.]|uniref:tyrosine-type recombinase/integrase n=1 Tax=Sulfurimonas sp. TaxID=2022749 RepID=UPI003D0EDACC
MKIGKYNSLGNGIQVRKSQDETYTYYYSFRDKIDKKVKRRKLFTAEKADNKSYAKAILMIENVLESEVEIKQKQKDDEKYILLNMKKYYIAKKTDDKHFELKKRYSKLSDQELQENTNYKEKIYNVKKEGNRFDKALSTIYVDKGKRKKFIDLDVREITEDMIEKVVNTQLHSMSQKSTYNLVGLVRAIVNYNIKKLRLDCKNPFANLDINFKNVQKNRERYLSKPEILELLVKCKEYTSNPNVYNAVYLAVLTAGRKMTVLNVQKKDFDFKNNVLHLYNYKTEKRYKVFIPADAVTYFSNFLKEFDEDEYVIKNFNSRTKTKQPFRAIPKKIYELMDDLFNEGLDKQDNDVRDRVVNFHTIRRSVATNLALDNVSIYKIMRLLNHSNIKQTQDYINLSDLNLSDEIESTHTYFYEHLRADKEMSQESMSVQEYLDFLKNDHFSNEQDVADFEKKVTYWEFKLKEEFEDGKSLDDFDTIQELKNYFDYRKEFALYEDYLVAMQEDTEESDDEYFDWLHENSNA